LDAVFRPRSVAVIGASRQEDSIGAALFHNLLSHRFEGPVYPVHPHARVVRSVTAYPDVESIPGEVDLAVIIVPAPRAVEVLEACGRKGVRGAVVISAGFREIGPEGAERERQLLDCARRHGIRLIGPNCLGVLNTEPAVRLDATFAPAWPPPGPVAFSSQSGALGLAILETATQLGVGISHFASIGNKADVSGNDLLEYWMEDPGTRVILLYLESFGNPRRFLEIARRVTRSKPVVAVKSGRTSAGARAASSHTGSLAGADIAVDALCRQAGVIRTDTIEEMFDVAMLLAHQPVPRGPRVAIVTNAGGPGIMATDACESHGLELPVLSEATIRGLREFLPPEASFTNPVDMIASATAESYARAVRLTLEDPHVDAVLAIFVPPIVTAPLAVAQAIVRGTAEAAETLRAQGVEPKPIVSCFLGSHGVPEGLQSLQKNHIPSYTFPEAAAIALARAERYGRWRTRDEVTVPEFEDIDRNGARAAIAKALEGMASGSRRWLTPREVATLGCAYGLPLLPTRSAADVESAVAAAAELGFPVAVKLDSDELTHKSEVGGVELGLGDARAVRDAFHRVIDRAMAIAPCGAPRGVVVQPMSVAGVEVIVGASRDRTFGPLLMFGSGGVLVELMQDVQFRIAPVTARDVREMMSEVKGSPLLLGYRGSPPTDIPALEDLVLRVSQCVVDIPEVVELDLNPVRVLPAGSGCAVLDARIAVQAWP
jgi:acetyl coenzyme A synthetase (ADP forming)-like protein